MISRLLTACILFLLLSASANAQTFLHGKVYEAPTDSVMTGVNVTNTKTWKVVQSASDGSYSIAALEGDRIIFSMPGYKSDTVIVTYGLLLTQYDVTLISRAISLSRVIVKSSYYADSLERRNAYRGVYNLPGITGRNRPDNGFGVSISPLSYFSYKAKRQRQLKKRLLKEEQDSYIDYAFPAPWVERLTDLHGDSLRLFMYRYRPSYSFCRTSTREDMVIYISDKLKEFRKPKNP